MLVLLNSTHSMPNPLGDPKLSDYKFKNTTGANYQTTSNEYAAGMRMNIDNTTYGHDVSRSQQYQNTDAMLYSSATNSEPEGTYMNEPIGYYNFEQQRQSSRQPTSAALQSSGLAATGNPIFTPSIQNYLNFGESVNNAQLSNNNSGVSSFSSKCQRQPSLGYAQRNPGTTARSQSLGQTYVNPDNQHYARNLSTSHGSKRTLSYERSAEQQNAFHAEKTILKSMASSYQQGQYIQQYQHVSNSNMPLLNESVISDDLIYQANSYAGNSAADIEKIRSMNRTSSNNMTEGNLNRYSSTNTERPFQFDSMSHDVSTRTNKRVLPCTETKLNWAQSVKESEFIEAEHVGLVSDLLLFAIAQMKPCGLTRDDRVGKYKTREIGFVGMCCKHCNGQPGFGRYFPGSFDSFLNGKNCESIVNHLQYECRKCPSEVRNGISELDNMEKMSKSRAPHGSRKVFFQHVWIKLRSLQVSDTTTKTSFDLQQGSSETSFDQTSSNWTNENVRLGNNSNSSRHERISSDSDNRVRSVDELDTDMWRAIVGDSEIVSIDDQYLVPATLLIAFSQMKRCTVETSDRIGRCKSHKVGFRGMCCKHCGGKSGKPGYGRYFPSSLRSLAQVDSCQQVVRHIASKCTHCPLYIKNAINEAIKLESSSRIRYGSRTMFYRRVWTRLHEGEEIDDEPLDLSAHDDGTFDLNYSTFKDDGDDEEKDEMTKIPWDKILNDSPIVTYADRKLVTASEVAAIAQMSPCRLTVEDQVGWFKDRPVGAGGLTCRHCGGKPSYGRYFPKSSRSFAQTTCGQTIMNHVVLYCKNVPTDIRDAIVKLQTMESSDQGMSSTGSQIHGSRKVFYDRIWKVLQQNNHNRKHQNETAVHQDRIMPIISERFATGIGEDHNASLSSAIVLRSNPISSGKRMRK